MFLAPVVGIDVGKHFSELAIIAPDNSLYRRQKIKHTTPSLSKALELVKKAEEDFGVKPAIVMEATGHYNKILFNFFERSGYGVIVVNPIQTDSIKNLSVRKVKTDKVDARRIALLYRFSELRQSHPPGPEIEMLRSLCRQYHCLVEERSTYKYRMLSILDQIMLNYKDVFSDIYSDTSLSLLEKYPSPEALLAADQAEFVSFLMTHSRKSQTWATRKYELICSKALEFKELSLANPANIAMLRNYIALIKTFNQLIKEMQQNIENLIATSLDSTNPVVAKQVYLLMSIPGIGLITAATIISEIGDIANFKNASKLTAFFGLDPSVCQSGQFNATQNRISKRGARLLRKALYMVAVINIMQRKDREPANPYLQKYYQQKCNSKPKKVAMVAIMRKLVGFIFAVLRDQSPFVLRDPAEHARTLTEQPSEALLSA